METAALYQGILVPDFDAAGIVEGYYALITDISDRKQTEHILQTTSAELDRFFSVALDPLCIANTDGYFLRRQPCLGRDPGLFPERTKKSNSFLDFVHPDDLDSTLAAMAQLADQQEILNFVNRYRHQDGSLPLDRMAFHPGGQPDLCFGAGYYRAKTGRNCAASQ